MSHAILLPRPAPGEHAPYYGRYVGLVPDGDVLAELRAEHGRLLSLLAPLDEAAALHRYAPAKWSVKELLGHLVDSERVFVYRAMAAARGDGTPQPGFSEDDWVAAAGFDVRPLAALLDEADLVRRHSLAFFAGLPPAALARQGNANGHPFSVRFVPWLLAGHARHHRQVLEERYLGR